MENFNQQFAEGMPIIMPSNGTSGYASSVNSGPMNAQSMQNSDQIPVNCDEAMGITTLHDLEMFSRGAIVRLPDFAEGMPFVARMKRPSMLALAKSGKIPNALLESANSLFEKGNKGVDVDDPNMMKDMYDVMKVVCESALISPSYNDILSVGMDLTDEQMMAIFSYAQVGVKALESFRKEQKDIESIDTV